MVWVETPQSRYSKVRGLTEKNKNDLRKQYGPEKKKGLLADPLLDYYNNQLGPPYGARIRENCKSICIFALNPGRSYGEGSRLRWCESRRMDGVRLKAAPEPFSRSHEAESLEFAKKGS